MQRDTGRRDAARGDGAKVIDVELHARHTLLGADPHRSPHGCHRLAQRRGGAAVKDAVRLHVACHRHPRHHPFPGDLRPLDTEALGEPRTHVFVRKLRRFDRVHVCERRELLGRGHRIEA